MPETVTTLTLSAKHRSAVAVAKFELHARAHLITGKINKETAEKSTAVHTLRAIRYCLLELYEEIIPSAHLS